MKNICESLFGEKLKSARRMSGLSLQDLADKMNGIVTKQSLSRYELGVMEPTGKVVIELSKSLNVKPDYFFKRDTVSLGEVSFRKRLALPKKEEDLIIEKVKDYIGKYLDLEGIMASSIQFFNPLKDFRIESFEDVANAAIKLREIWGLGSGPITNVLQMLEGKGFKVYVVEVSGKFDGIATLINSSIPVIVVNKSVVERMRFTSIHEAAHLLLMLSDTVKADDKLVELYCHYFASCFLLPTAKFVEMLGSKRDYITIKELIMVKELYGISLRAQLYKAKKLGMISEVYHTKWSVYLTKKYGAKEEPGNYPGLEEPLRFRQLISRAVSEEIISINKASALSDISVSELTKELEMPE